MPIRTIENGDFVNDGRQKFNESLGEIPVSFVPTPAGDLVITKHNGGKITVPLKNFFALLTQIAGSFLPGTATADEPGIVLLVDDDVPEHYESDARILTAGQITRLLAAFDPANSSTLDALSKDTAELLTPIFEATGAGVILEGADGPIVRQMEFSRLAEYVVDRMAPNWQRLLFQKLIPALPTALDDLAKLLPGLQAETYEANGALVLLSTPTGPVIRYQSYERFSEYVADRIPLPWQIALMIKLIQSSPDALDRLARNAPGLQNATYEAHGAAAVLQTPTGPVLVYHTYERMAEYIVENMSLSWNQRLFDRLLDRISPAQVCRLKQMLADADCDAMPPAAQPVFVFGSFFRSVQDAPVPVANEPTVVSSVGRYDTDRGWLNLANARNGNNFDSALIGANGTPWTDVDYRESIRFGGDDLQGSYLTEYGYLPDGDYTAIWNPANTGPDKSVRQNFTVQHTYRGSVDANNCDRPDDPSSSYKFSGWAVDLLHIKRSVVVVLYCDGIEDQRQTCQIRRADVRTNLLQPQYGYQGEADAFGFEFVKGSKGRDGQPHIWEARVLGDDTEFTYNAPKSVSCGSDVPPPGPYVIDYKVEGNTSIVEGGGIGSYYMNAIYNDGGVERYDGGAINQVDNRPGLTRTSIGNGSECTLQLAADSIPANDYVGLRFIIGGGIQRSIEVQLVNSVDTRPANLTTYKASYRIIRNNSPRIYNTLTDANETACKHFKNIEPGDLDLFFFQAASLNNGELCYLGNTTNNTATLSNQIYYVTDVNGNDTVLRSMQVSNGRIVQTEVNPNSCQVVANRPPVKINPTGSRSLTPGTAFVYQFPTNVFSDPDNDPIGLSLAAEDEDAPTLVYGPLPAWLSFDPATRTLSGNVPNEAGLHLALRLTGSDGRGGVAYDYFPVTTPAPTANFGVNKVAVFRASNDSIQFLYRSSQFGDQNLEDNWTPIGGAYLPSGYANPPALGRPAGYEDYQYVDPYPGDGAFLTALNSPSTFSIRKVGQASPFISFQFTAPGLAIGEVRVIYTT